MLIQVEEEKLACLKREEETKQKLQEAKLQLKEIAEKYPEVEVECVPGSGGVFKIIMDGKVLFDKKMTGRYPEEGEILSLIE